MEPVAEHAAPPRRRAPWAGAAVGLGALVLWGGVSWWAAPNLRTPDPKLADPPRAAFTALPADDLTLDQGQLDLARTEVRDVHAAFGPQEPARQARACFRRLEREPTGRLLDYCIALDTYGLALHRAGGAKTDAEWYAGAQRRHLKAAETVLMGRGEAAARVGDLHRLMQIDVRPPPTSPKVIRTKAPRPKAVRKSPSRRYAERAPAERRPRPWNHGMSKSF